MPRPYAPRRASAKFRRTFKPAGTPTGRRIAGQFEADLLVTARRHDLGVPEDRSAGWRGNTDAALKTFTAAALTAAQAPEVRNRGRLVRAQLYADRGQVAKARKDLNTIVAWDSNYPGVREAWPVSTLDDRRTGTTRRQRAEHG